MEFLLDDTCSCRFKLTRVGREDILLDVQEFKTGNLEGGGMYCELRLNEGHYIQEMEQFDSVAVHWRDQYGPFEVVSVVYADWADFAKVRPVPDEVFIKEFIAGSHYDASGWTVVSMGTGWDEEELEYCEFRPPCGNHLHWHIENTRLPELKPGDRIDRVWVDQGWKSSKFDLWYATKAAPGYVVLTCEY